MASRFRRNVGRSENTQGPEDGLTSESWAPLAVMALATVAVLALSGGARPTVAGLTAAPADPTEQILRSLGTADRSLEAIDEEFTRLCREPVLAALELVPDCENGRMTLPARLFQTADNAQLRPGAREDVAAAMTAYLARLRRLPALWEGLEAIEIRGHADPRALRDAYRTNLVGSQQRALGVLLFLIGPGGVDAADRAELERLAIVSGASYSRPPESCPEATRECFRAWRRVEIVPVLSEARRREQWARTVEDVRVITRRTQDRLSELRR